APGRRLALWRGLGDSLRFLDLAFEPGDLDVTLANLGLQFLDASPQALGFGSAVSADVVARHLLRNRQFPGPGHASLLRMGFAGEALADPNRTARFIGGIAQGKSPHDVRSHGRRRRREQYPLYDPMVHDHRFARRHDQPMFRRAIIAETLDG